MWLGTVYEPTNYTKFDKLLILLFYAPEQQKKLAWAFLYVNFHYSLYNIKLFKFLVQIKFYILGGLIVPKM